MLRVPGTLNTHSDRFVKITHDSEEISLYALIKGLDYVSERIRKTNSTASKKKTSKKPQEYEEFINQLKKDILLIHPSSDKYVCLCLKKKEKWQSGKRFRKEAD